MRRVFYRWTGLGGEGDDRDESHKRARGDDAEVDADRDRGAKTRRYAAALSKEVAQAMFYVLVDRMTYREAVQKLGNKNINISTLHRRVSAFLKQNDYDSVDAIPNDRRVNISVAWLERHAQYEKCGRPLLLEPDLDCALSVVLSTQAANGSCLTMGSIIGLVRRCCSVELKRSWFRNFFQRYAHLGTRVGRTLDVSRSIGETRLPDFLNEHAQYLEHADPDLVGNLDEAMCNNRAHCKVIGLTMQQVAHFAGRETEIPHISVMPLVIASGILAVSLIIMAHERGIVRHYPHDHPLVREGRVEFAGSLNGFITTDIFETFFEQRIVPWIDRHRERLGKASKTFFLLLDGHASHLSVRTVKLAYENNVALLYFPSHTSHRVQPLDRGFFNVFKIKLIQRNMVTTEALSSLPLATRVDNIIGALQDVGREVIVGAFKHSGMHPFDRERALMHERVQHSVFDETPCEKVDLEGGSDAVIERYFGRQYAPSGAEKDVCIEHERKIVRNTATSETHVVRTYCKYNISSRAWEHVGSLSKARDEIRDQERRRPRTSFTTKGVCSASPGFLEKFRVDCMRKKLRKCTRKDVVKKLADANLTAAYNISGKQPAMADLVEDILARMDFDVFQTTFGEDGGEEEAVSVADGVVDEE